MKKQKQKECKDCTDDIEKFFGCNNCKKIKGSKK